MREMQRYRQSKAGRSGNFGWLYLAVCLIVSGMMPTKIQAQIYSGPASGSISGGAVVSTGSLDKMPKSNLPMGQRVRAFNPFASNINAPYIDDKFDNSVPTGPLQSNEINLSDAPEGSVLEAPFVLNSFQAFSDNGGFPPDPVIAVGPDHVIASVNSAFRIYDKEGTLVFNISADAWFGNVRPYGGSFDPIVVYDHIDERWIICFDLQDNSSTGYWLVSVSETSNPLGEWMNFSFPAHLNGTANAGNWGDYQKVGYDENAVYISANQFSFSSQFAYVKVRIIPKSELYAHTGGAVTYKDYWDFRDPGNPSVTVFGPLMAVASLDSPGNKAYLLVDSPYNTANFVTLWTIEDPLAASPTVTAVNIPTTAVASPPNGNQAGGTAPRLESGNRRYRMPVYQDGKIYAVSGVAGGFGLQSGFARYLVIDAETKTLDADVSFGENDFYYLFPAITPDEDGNIFMAFTRSGDDDFAGVAIAGRRTGDPAGVSDVFVTKEGEGLYNRVGNGRNRWGDYMGIARDPKYGNMVWSIVEYAGAGNSWQTWIDVMTYEFYGAGGIVQDAGNGDPIPLASIEIPELNRTITSGEDGSYLLASPIDGVTMNVDAFGYQPQSFTPTLALNDTNDLNINLQPEAVVSFSGTVVDASSGGGVAADLEFYADGDPTGGPYRTTTTDPDGNFNISTIVGSYRVEIYPQAPYAYTIIEDITLSGGGLNTNLEVSPASLMLVDDDDGSTHEVFYRDALETEGYSYHWWDVQADGSPAVSDLEGIPSRKVIWYTGDSDGNSLGSDEAADLVTFLNNGGKLLLSGQDVVEENSGGALMNQLGLSYVTNFLPALVTGTPGGLADGFVLITSGGAANNQTSKDILAISDTLTTKAFLNYGGSPTNVAGAAYNSGASKALVMGFGWEGINDEEDRTALLGNMVAYLDSVSVGIDDLFDPATQANDFALAQNYPNPFNPTTSIVFQLPKQAEVSLVIYNTLGERVRTLTSQSYAAGTYQLTWDGKNDNGSEISSGIYFYRLVANKQFVDMKKMVFLK